MQIVWGNEGVYFNEDGTLKKDGTYTADGTSTKFGIAYKFNKAELLEFGINSPEQMNQLGVTAAAEIYKRKYWHKCGAETIKDYALAYLIFDCAVNQGIGASIRIVQEAINTLSDKKPIKIDGGLGPVTKAKILEVSANYSHSFAKLVRILREREYYQSLFNRCLKAPDEAEALFQRFETSWMRRLTKVEL